MSKSERLEQVKQKFDEIHANPPRTLKEIFEEYGFPVLELDEDDDLEPLYRPLRDD